jgi:hypothetical protein
MTSKNKLKKLKNAFLAGGCLKNSIMRLKRLLFYTSSERKANRDQEKE